MSGDTRASPTLRNFASGTNGVAEFVGEAVYVDILERRYICCRSSSPQPSHSDDCAVPHGLEDDKINQY